MLLFCLENNWCFAERLHIVREESDLRSQKQKKRNVAFVLFLHRRQLHQPDAPNIYETASIIFPSHVFLLIWFVACLCVFLSVSSSGVLILCFFLSVTVVVICLFVCDSGAMLILCVCVRWQPLDRTLGNAYTHNDRSSLTMIALPPDFFITIMKSNQFANMYAFSPNSTEINHF